MAEGRRPNPFPPNRWRRSKEDNHGQGPSFNNRRTNFNNGNRNAGIPGESSRNHGNKNRGDNRKGPFFGFRMLENLLQKTPEQILEDLMASEKTLVPHLQTELNDDFYVMIIKIFRKVCDSEFQSLKRKIFQIYLNNEFIKKLTVYLNSVVLHDQQDKYRNRKFWDDTDDFWCNLIKISENVLKELPSFALNCLPKLIKTLALVIPNFEAEHSCHIADEIVSAIEKLEKSIDALSKELAEKAKLEIQSKNRQTAENVIEQEPPNDFREIGVYPTVEELLADKPEFLRENVVKGPYRDVDHYLDVQYRLLREDFVAPLRAGLKIHFENLKFNRRNRLENIRIHKRVQFLNAEVVNDNTCYRIQFNFNAKTKNKKTDNYKYSKKFMNGALICLTRDNFNSMVFGRIVKREIEDLEKGEIIVGFDANVQNIFYNTDYLMVECSVFFEPYYHVLHQLKRMSVDEFPMERYIIRVERDVQRPKYLENHMDLNDSASVREINRTLNQSQQLAFQAALRQEIVIIQGPPGTGKTHLALKIAQTLIEHKDVWYKHTPLLVICFTNHALDQFLEGISHFTESIIRVGSQSKNANLEKFNLRKKHVARKNQAFYRARDEVKSIVKLIQDCTSNLYDLLRLTGLIRLEVRRTSVKRCFQLILTMDDFELLSWLTGAYRNFGKPNLPRVKVVDSTIDKGSDEEEEEKDEIDDVFDLRINVDTEWYYEIRSSRFRITEIKQRLTELLQNEYPRTEDFIEYEKLSKELVLREKEDSIFPIRLDQVRQSPEGLRQFAAFDIDFENPYELSLDDRWSIYFHLLNKMRLQLIENIDNFYVEYRKSYIIYEELKNIEDIAVMKESLVLGMTTTCAARLQSSLNALKCPIVIVEEAAEVLEAHIITALTKHVQHLILIGDHQQLKPSTADYSIEKKFKLGTSLFERMIINDIQYFTLNVQHRMKPELAALIAPTIYPNLQNHESVFDRKRIRGIDNSLFFLDHEHPENDIMETSKINLHEIEFLLKFARHLILNGYKAENITILAAYLGQMFELKKEKKEDHLLKEVRVAVLDNYQGEESEIILLSLVRNNPEAKIGFLKIINRVCVALSRARDGLYIMGNMKQLCQSGPTIWPYIHEILKANNNIGTALPLRCEIHRDKVTLVKEARDFFGISEGGCDQICDKPLICDHRCTKLCHIVDADHTKYICHQTCNKPLCNTNPLHICTKPCFEKCGPCKYQVEKELPCKHVVPVDCHLNPEDCKCPVEIEVELPCGHVTQKPCYRDPLTYPCPFPCESIVEPCGHACVQKCHKQNDPDHLKYKCRKQCARHNLGCTVKDDLHLCRLLCFEECARCAIPVKKTREVCLHVYEVECHFDVNSMACLKPCKKLLPCGHKCKNRCNEPCTEKCDAKVEKQNPICLHPIKVKCHQEPDRKLCSRKCPLQLACGHNCTKKCNEPCTANCLEMVDVNLALLCGHVATKLPCHLRNSPLNESALKYCTSLCTTEMQCKHKCTGSCGECYQGRVHKPCQEKCGAILICNHECRISCREACKPCTLDCTFRCTHSRCNKKCGDICTPCKERCDRKCPHQQCNRFCSDFCNIEPCNEPCQIFLECGHPCIGFCGEPCPPKCMVCDKKEVLEIFFGTEEEDARYVWLEDCGHVLESSGLDQWISQDEEIGYKQCPKCKTHIKKCKRYKNQIRQAMKDVIDVKKKNNGDNKTNEAKRVELLVKAENLTKEFRGLTGYQIVVDIQNRLKKSHGNKRNTFNTLVLNALTAKIQIMENVLRMCKQIKLETQRIKLINSNANVIKHFNIIKSVLSRSIDSISNQEIDDLSSELDRLLRIIQYEDMIDSIQYRMIPKTSEVVDLTTKIENQLYALKKYTKEDDADLIRNLTEFGKKIASALKITEGERNEIVKAMGLQKGHWYKCKNGHPYVITECGGAMQRSNCPECNAPIGGSNHRLDSSNRVATEMDGAQHGAWSEQNNLANFALDNIF